MEFVQLTSWDESAKLGEERGYYPGYVDGLPKRRNIVVQVVAPTGTISRLAKCSFGIEPIYAGVQESYILGRTVPFIDKHPLRDSKHFITADEISLDQHIDILTAIQAHTDQAVSKTCNAAEETTPEQVSDALITAYEGGAKGITILRKNSRVKVVIKDHSGKHDHDGDPDSDLPEGLDKQQVDCVGGVCEM
jgi:ribonucleoside-diphosphate reductase alpha chain